MGKCNFSIDFSMPAETLVSNAEQAITGAGGSFSGDQAAGSFQLSTPIGSVKGAYQIEDNTIHINVTDKPMLVSCHRIEEELRKRLL